MCARFGYKPGAVANGYATIGTTDSLNQRATISARMAEHGWGYQRGIRGGRVDTLIPDVTLPIWATDAAVTPDILIGTTDLFTTGTYMLNAADGIEYVRDLQTAVMLRSGKRYALGFVATDARFGYATLPTNMLASGEYDTEYLRSVPGAPTAQNPFGETSTTARGWIATWVEYEPNVAPDAPTTRSPGIDAVVSTLTPTFEGDFRDDNEALPNLIAGGDMLLRYSVEVRVAAAATLLWSTTRTASTAERAARRFSVAYVGPALATNTSYEWRALVRDEYDVASAWSTWLTFSAGAGTVTASAGTPTGKQQTVTPGPFTGGWNHSGALGANAASVIIYDRVTGGVVTEGPLVTVSAASGGTISIPWASAGLTTLQWGGDYQYAIRARDTANVLSAYSDRRGFTVNAAPGVPNLVTPTNGSVISSRPVLIADVTDADDTPTTGLIVSARIKNAAGTVLFTRAMTYQSSAVRTDGVTLYRYAYTTTSVDLATTGDYRWDAWSNDGTVYSSGNPVLGQAALSPEATFAYSAGPSVTHTGAVSPVPTNTPVYDWDTTGQVRARVQVYATTGGLLVYDSGDLGQTVTNHTQPAGYLDNGGSYYRVIRVWDAANQEGVSAPYYFSVSYANPALVGNLTAAPQRARTDVTPTATLLSWTPTTYPASQFQMYVVSRRAVSGQAFDVDDPVGSAAVRVGEITSASQTTFVDFLPASGVTYSYGVKQVVVVDGQTLAGDFAHVEGRVDFQETIICDVQDPDTYRLVLPAREERTWKRNREQAIVHPWNSSKPTVMRTKRWGRELSPTVFPIVAETPEDARRVVIDGDELDQRGGPLCYRDGRGARYFGEMTAYEHLDPPGGRVQRVSIGFLQTSAREVLA